ncbi:MAG: hypothetical protein J7L42_05145, partial [Elusimicrobia bacterium]|nr:hypothetical protein [Elusimicrobiota bacterium]
MRAKVFIICYILSLNSLFAQVIVNVHLPAQTTLKEISEKYLKNPDSVKKLYKYNINLPQDLNTPLDTTEIKIPRTLLKDRVGDVVFFHPLAKTRKEKESLWKDLKPNQRLFPGDGVMTWDGGNVKIKFLAGGELTVATDSLIFLKEPRSRPVTRFLAGNLSVDDVKIVSHGVAIEPKKGAQYNVNTSAEKDVRLSVHKGEVDVTAKNKTVRVKEGFKTLVKFGRAPELPTPLPPGVTDIHKLRDLKENEKYHLQIATDKTFKNLVVDRYFTKKEELEEARTNLPPGGYYLRIALLTADGFESKWSNFYYFVKGPESKDKLKIFSIKQVSEAELEVSGYYPGIVSVMINGYTGKIFQKDKFKCRFDIKG